MAGTRLSVDLAALNTDTFGTMSAPASAAAVSANGPVDLTNTYTFTDGTGSVSYTHLTLPTIA